MLNTQLVGHGHNGVVRWPARLPELKSTGPFLSGWLYEGKMQFYFLNVFKYFTH